MRSTQRTQALAAGISILIMAIAAAFSYGYVLSDIKVQGDTAATFEQLVTNSALFKASLGGWLLIFLTDLIVTFSLYLFFRETRKRLSLATAATRLIYTAVLGIALIRLFSILPFLKEQGIEVHMAAQQMVSTLESFEAIWNMGLIIFGLHLLGLGYLSVLSRQIPRVFGYLLLLAGISYLVIHTSISLTLFREEVISMMVRILMVPMALSEILLAFWLIIRGGKKLTKYISIVPQHWLHSVGSYASSNNSRDIATPWSTHLHLWNCMINFLDKLPLYP